MQYLEKKAQENKEKSINLNRISSGNEDNDKSEEKSSEGQYYDIEESDLF